MGIDLYSWGACEEVTGSKHFLSVNNETVMVDCGAFQGHREEADEKNRNWRFDASKVSSMILTHGHYDHCGLIPMLPKKRFYGNIYTTPASRDIASLIMMDSAHIQAKDIEYLQKKAKKKHQSFDKKPMYDERDVVNSLTQIISIPYHREFYVANNTTAEFFDAGHILGSAITLFSIGKGLKIGFSGDLGRKGLPILRDPEYLPPIDYLVMESTYGDRLHDPIDRAREKLAEVVNRTSERGGKIIIPSFAVERTQELVYFLHLLRDEGRIPSLPIYVDSPMATNATSIFRVHQECYDENTRKVFLDHHKNPFGFEELSYVVSTEESKRLNGLNKPAVIISASGMCESGRILHHLANNIENPRNTILIVGFMAKNTLGRRILEHEKEVKIFGDRYRVRAEVRHINAFSAHADYRDIMEYIGKLDKKRLKRIFLVHGEPQAQANLKRLLKEKGYRVTIMKYGERYRLV